VAVSAPSASASSVGPGLRPGAPDRALLSAVLGALCISSSAIVVTLAHTGDATAAVFRCLLAVPGLAALAARERRRHGPRPTPARRGAWCAGVLLGVELVLWNHAIGDVGAGVATVLSNLQVVVVAVAAWALMAERPSRRLLACLPVLAVGVVLVSGLFGPRAVGDRPAAGLLFGLATSLAYAVYLLVLRRCSGSAHVAGPLLDATLGAVVGSLVVGLAAGGLSLHPGWRALGWLLLLALLSQTLGWLLITSSLPRLPAAVTSVLLLLQPAAALVLGAVVLDEVPSGLQLGGAALVCGGVVLATARRPGVP
jgi:drug/metabolite transporter (DMT)-like permease